ncbi:helix-turn-helix transcriptional regulator [Elongatibacter sediminis]|uniref:AraC family transcriptional regulator n=1 Tax=Elongatibacter sediminis TaxID=3119006 RepID=A0AAW9REW9_9GAMM
MEPVRCPFDEVLHHSPSLLFGEFRCRVQEPRFTDTGPIENHLLVVPSRPVEIHFSRGRSVVADRTRVLFYNRGTRYRREALNRYGDHCLWFAFADDQLAQRCGGPAHRPYRDPVRHLPQSAYLEIRRLYARVRRGAADPLEVEDTAFSLLARLLETGVETGPVSARQQRTVTAAEAYLAAHYGEAVRLDEVATAVACSPFHLSRLFRRLRGIGLHQHLSELRLRDAVDRVCDSDEPLTDIAMDLGFSSPSHFSSRFSDRLGVTPSRFRQQWMETRAIS